MPPAAKTITRRLPPKAKPVINELITPVDRLIARNLCSTLSALGWTRARLAAAMSMSEQGIDKYCNAHARVPASRLWVISKAMNVSILLFYRGADEMHRHGG